MNGLTLSMRSEIEVSGLKGDICLRGFLGSPRGVLGGFLFTNYFLFEYFCFCYFTVYVILCSLTLNRPVRPGLFLSS